MQMKFGAALLLATVLGPGGAPSFAAPSAASLYTRALARERVVRDAARTPTLQQIRAAIKSYDAIVRRYPTSGYSDNALWQAGNLALLAFDRFGDPGDRRTAVRLLTELKTRYPTSSLVPRVDSALRHSSGPAPATPVDPTAPSGDQPVASSDTVPAAPVPVAIRDIKRTPLPDGTRVSIEMDGESAWHAERLDGPPRVFFDIQGARPVAALQDATLRFTSDVVKEIRLGRHPQNTTRVVMDMDGVENYSVFTLYNPFRLIIDFKAAAAGSPAAPVASQPPPATGPAAPPIAPPPASSPSQPPAMSVSQTEVAQPPLETKPLSSRPVTAAPPALPAANSNGKFSLARQLGLGVSRIVIDAGHGGHDPGAQSNGVVEAELVLDVARRLARLIQKQTAIEVVMTRDSDVFIPLEERTVIANREGADLFLSIHANASRNASARGIETYFLNFASNPEAEAVAARENSASGRTMHSLPEIVRAIALNNKIDESRDFAEMVQRSMVRRLAVRNRQVKDLGVKQAPFVVLIGAAMPSVLAEISFVTHRQEGQLLKSASYRQQIAESLFDAVLRYQQSLKKLKTVRTATKAER